MRHLVVRQRGYRRSLPAHKLPQRSLRIHWKMQGACRRHSPHGPPRRTTLRCAPQHRGASLRASARVRGRGAAYQHKPTQVLVRIRPPAEPGASVSAEARSATVVRLHGRAARAEEDPTCTDSAFDAVEGPGASQADVYAHVQPLVTAVAAGRNACVLAFGQTASGKTHTMLGPSPPARGRAGAADGERSEEEGIIPRALAELLAARRAAEAPPPTHTRTKWTRRVPHPVLIGHAASLTGARRGDADRVQLPAGRAPRPTRPPEAGGSAPGPRATNSPRRPRAAAAASRRMKPQRDRHVTAT